MKNIPGPAGFHAQVDRAKDVTMYSVALERKRTIVSYFFMECCWLQMCRDLGVDMTNCCPLYTDELYLSEAKFQQYLLRWTDALIQSEVLLCDVAPSTQPGGEHENVTPGHTANADPTRREHATLWQVSRGAFDFRTPRLAVVVDAVVTTCTGDVILKLVDTTGSSVAFTTAAAAAVIRPFQAFGGRETTEAKDISSSNENAFSKQFRQLHPGSALLLRDVAVYVHRDATAAGRWSRYLCITLSNNIVAIYN